MIMASRQQFAHRERYISELPFSVMNKVHNILDIGQGWMKLAEGLGYSFQETELFAQAKQRYDGSPAKELLLDWSHKNPTVSDLYRHLLANKLNLAADHLKEYVIAREPPQQDVIRPEIPKGIHPGYYQQHNLRYTGNQTPLLGSLHSKLTQPVASIDPIQSMQNLPPPPVPPDDTDRLYAPGQPPKVAQPHTAALQHNQSYNTILQNQVQNQPPKLVPHKFDSDNYMTSMSSDGMRRNEMQLQGDVQVSRRNVRMDHGWYPPIDQADGSGRSPNATGSSTVKLVKPGPRSWSDMSSSYPLTTISSQDDAASLRSTLSISYKDIQAATGNFDEGRLIGSGGFGSVYLGEIARTPMAIKILKEKETFKNPEEKYQHQIAEVRALTRFRHPNIVTLSGYCMEGPQLCLIYEFMKHGSLEDKLVCKNGQEPLAWWPWRYRILTDAARGLQYLHCAEKKPYVHGDIKSANILLDEHLKAKIADFNLAKEATGINDTGKYTHITKKQMTEVMYGSKAYLPSDFFTNEATFSTSTDVFSFGMVIFEVCVGGKALDNNRKPPLLRDRIEDILAEDNEETLKNRNEAILSLKDPKIPEWPDMLWMSLFDLGKACTKKRKKDRPKMPDVLVALERLSIAVQVYGERTDVNRNQIPHKYSSMYSSGSSFMTSMGDSSIVGPSSQQSQFDIKHQQIQGQLPVPREQTDYMNQGPSLLQAVEGSGGSALSANDPRFQALDPGKKGQYAVQDSANVSYLTQLSSMESNTTVNSSEDSSSGGSTSTDIYTANDRCKSNPEVFTQQQAQVPGDHGRGRSLPYYMPNRPIPSSGSGLTEFFNAVPYQLQLQHDARSADPASLASQPHSMNPADHGYINVPAPHSMGHLSTPVHHPQPVSMVSASSTEELNNERNEEIEKSLESLNLDSLNRQCDSASLATVLVSVQANQVGDKRTTCKEIFREPGDKPQDFPKPQVVSSLAPSDSSLKGNYQNIPENPFPGSTDFKTSGIHSDIIAPLPTKIPDQTSFSQEISAQKKEKAALLPMPIETGDTGELCGDQFPYDDDESTEI